MSATLYIYRTNYIYIRRSRSRSFGFSLGQNRVFVLIYESKLGGFGFWRFLSPKSEYYLVTKKALFKKGLKTERERTNSIYPPFAFVRPFVRWSVFSYRIMFCLALPDYDDLQSLEKSLISNSPLRKKP